MDPDAPYELYMDGAAGSVMPPADGHPALWRDIGFFPYATEQPARVFIVGAGGGLDVWFALQANADEITAVEVNRASASLPRNMARTTAESSSTRRCGCWWMKGAASSAHEDWLYDLISLSQVVTAAAEPRRLRTGRE